MLRLRIKTDYSCWPIWDDEGEMYEPSEFPLSQDLIVRINQWQAKLDATLNLTEPELTGFKSEEDHQSFQEEGRELARRMQEELGEEYEIWYRNERVQVPAAA